MSQIGIGFGEADVSPKMLMALHKETGIGLIDLKRAAKQPGKTLFYTCMLYMNDHVERSRQINAILEIFEDNSKEPFLFEILYDEKWSDFNLDEKQNYITPDQLRNIADAEGYM
ncbi:hypothetical protein [Alterisphingorhabdus coralli]|uniref:Uncharacterized protein n=1 Tax=Alterisphingorhabdus coralli TaxID=3071408 RepID=A0AA97F712_9SPHN|nr:hypothetical protein [Parasphingorhabdus sp. SCSIO 66989]WOE74438.1 hypothetical protein RB602_11345 [Parasphingorhabdus sp. SCSIO 66989]